MTTVNWDHILLDPLIYQRAGTYRIARIPHGIRAFPHRGGSYDYSELWTPTDPYPDEVPDHMSPVRKFYYISADDGIVVTSAPPSVDVRGFRFAWWAVQQHGEGHIWGHTRDMNPLLEDVTSAKAYFVWDLASGPGRHSVFMDAFNVTTGQYLAEDFVESVEPDDTHLKKAEANNGLLRTEQVPDTIVTARQLIDDNIHDVLEFVNWEVIYSLHPEVSPIVDRNTLALKQGFAAYAIAYYRRSGKSIPPLEIAEAKIPYGWYQVVTGLAGGNLTVVGGVYPTNEPAPAGPPLGDTYLRALEKLSSKVTQLEARFRLIESRLPK